MTRQTSGVWESLPLRWLTRSPLPYFDFDFDFDVRCPHPQIVHPVADLSAVSDQSNEGTGEHAPQKLTLRPGNPPRCG